MNIGREFEKLWVRLFGGKLQKGSGNTPYAKLDVDAHKFLLSLKATQNKSFRITKEDLDEAKDAVYGPGGVGGEYVPALAFCLVQGDEPSPTDPIYVAIEAATLVNLLQQDVKVFAVDKETEKISIGNVPGLLRGNNSNPK